MKKLFTMLVLVIFAAGILAGCQTISGKNDDASASDDKPQPTAVTEFEYIVREDSALITRFVGDSKQVVIPAEIDGIPVTEIIDNAFAQNDNVVSVTLPETMTAVQNSAFSYCSNLTEVKLPDGLTHIGQSAFENCEKLTTVVLPESLEFIGAKAFYNCKSLKKINIPMSITTWREEAFGFSGLEEVELAEGLEKIGDAAFIETKLKAVVMPKSLKKIGGQTFANCSELKSVKLNVGLTEVGDHAFAVESKLKEMVIPASVKNITELAFSNCSNLKAVKFEGDAPENYEFESQWEIIGGAGDGQVDTSLAGDVNYTVYYHKDAKGFTSGEWCGYPTKIW